MSDFSTLAEEKRRESVGEPYLSCPFPHRPWAVVIFSASELFGGDQRKLGFHNVTKWCATENEARIHRVAGWKPMPYVIVVLKTPRWTKYPNVLIEWRDNP